MKDLLQLCICFILMQNAFAQESFVLRSTLSMSGSSHQFGSGGQTYLVQESIGQSGITGTFQSDGVLIRQGFIQPDAQTDLYRIPTFRPLSYSFYPNPVDTKLTLQFDTEIQENIQIDVFSILGVKLKSETFSPGKRFEISLVGLPSGQYLLKLSTNGAQSFEKIIRR